MPFTDLQSALALKLSLGQQFEEAGGAVRRAAEAPLRQQRNPHFGHGAHDAAGHHMAAVHAAGRVGPNGMSKKLMSSIWLSITLPCGSAA